MLGSGSPDDERKSELDANAILELLHQGGLTVYPLGLGSVIALAILMERVLRFRGLEAGTRALTRKTIESVVRREIGRAHV